MAYLVTGNHLFSESLGTHVLFEELGNTLISLLRNNLSYIT